MKFQPCEGGCATVRASTRMVPMSEVRDGAPVTEHALCRACFFRERVFGLVRGTWTEKKRALVQKGGAR